MMRSAIDPPRRVSRWSLLVLFAQEPFNLGTEVVGAHLTQTASGRTGGGDGVISRVVGSFEALHHLGMFGIPGDESIESCRLSQCCRAEVGGIDNHVDRCSYSIEQGDGGRGIFHIGKVLGYLGPDTQ